MPYAAVVLLTLLALAAPAGAQTAGQQPLEIPGSPLALGIEAFEGAPVSADPHRPLRVPQHPFMAPDPGSNIHNDAYQSDTYDRSGPLGDGISARSALFARECASVAFDRRGRIVTVCVGLDRPVLTVLDPDTLRPISTRLLPPRQRVFRIRSRASPAAATSTWTTGTGL